MGVGLVGESIHVASAHAEQDRSVAARLRYRHCTLEDVLQEGGTYDVVIASEVVEHVTEPGQFVAECCAAVAPGGLLFLSTLNRTTASYALAILMVRHPPPVRCPQPAAPPFHCKLAWYYSFALAGSRQCAAPFFGRQLGRGIESRRSPPCRVSPLPRVPNRGPCFGVVQAENVLGWVPPGTHSHDKFIRPAELVQMVERSGLAVDDIKGMSFVPFTSGFRLSDNTEINYILAASRPVDNDAADT